MTLEQAKEIVEEIQARTKMKAYSLKIVKDSQPDLFDSKFGGVPYWDMKQAYPADNNGAMLMLLAQINLEQVPLDERLPKQGMLQFFIGVDDVFGMNFDEPDRQNTYRVVYHEEIDRTVTREQVLSLHPPVSTDCEMEYTPIFVEAAVTIQEQEVCMGDTDYKFNQIFGELAKEKCGETWCQTLYGALGSEGYDEVMKDISNDGHWLFGYPFFTQSDPREYEDKLQYYDTLLFQIDSDFAGGDDYVLWGDNGVANFFINHEDLERRDFSKVLYNWDCY